MSAPGESTNIEFTSEPTLGLKEVALDYPTANAYLAGVKAMGGDGELVETPLSRTEFRPLYRIRITKLP